MLLWFCRYSFSVACWSLAMCFCLGKFLYGLGDVYLEQIQDRVSGQTSFTQPLGLDLPFTLIRQNYHSILVHVLINKTKHKSIYVSAVSRH